MIKRVIVERGGRKVILMDSISHVNPSAASLGVKVGERLQEAVVRLLP